MSEEAQQELLVAERRREVKHLFWWFLVAGTTAIVLQVGRAAMAVEAVIAAWNGVWLAAAICVALVALATWGLRESA